MKCKSPSSLSNRNKTSCGLSASRKDRRVTGMKTALVLFLLLLISTLAGGCGSSGSGGGRKSSANISSQEVDASLMKIAGDATAADPSLPEMVIRTSANDEAELNFTAACDADYSLISGYYHAWSKEGLAHEITLIRVKNEEDISTVMESLKQHAQSRIDTMQAYSPDQLAIAEKYHLTHQGNYIGLFICEKSGLAGQAFKESEKNNGI